MLKLGRGRAYLLVKDHYDPSFRDPILHACLQNLAYDRQLEGTRGWYMYTIIHATNDFAFYRDAIYSALLKLTAETEDYDIQHIFRLAANIAEDDDTEMREAIIQKFLAMPALGGFTAGEEIIRLDGIDGFIYVAELLSEQMRQHGLDFIVGEHTYSADIGLFFALQDGIGEEEAKAAVETLRTERPSITPILDAIDQWRRPAISQKRKKSKPRPYAEIKQMIESPNPDREFTYRFWGKKATEDDITQAAQDLLIQSDPVRLRDYLRIFWERPFPLDPAALITLAQHTDWDVAIRAIIALEKIEHPSVRAFALESIERGYSVGRMVGLLQQGSNYQESDWAIIENLTRQVNDEDDFHWLGFAVREVFEQHPTPLAIPTLLNLYRNGPCGNCREAFVDSLVQLEAIPDWLREEAEYDSYSYVREAIEKLTNKGE